MSGAGPRPAPASATRYWGWHRLTADWAAELVSRAGVRPGDLVLDLGAGDGALTAPLADAGARVLAIELHPGRVQRLQDRFADCPQVRVLPLDLALLRLPNRPFSVVANPPWSLARPLLRQLTVRNSSLQCAHLVLQRGLVGELDRRGLAGSARRRFDTRAAGAVPRTAFRPAPPGSAAVLQVLPARRR